MRWNDLTLMDKVTGGILALLVTVTLTTLVIMTVEHFTADDEAGPTGLIGTTVQLQSGRIVECVLARDQTARGVAVSIDCDW